MRGSVQFMTGAASAALYLSASAPAYAQAGARDYRIEAQDLGAALRTFASASEREVIADADLIGGKRNAPLIGRFDTDSAIRIMLAGTGLRAELVEGAFVIRRAPIGEPGEPSAEVVVTGTRIRGAGPIGAPVIVVDRTAIEQSGRGTIQGLLETIPSNFGGGQNEAVAGTTSRNNAGDNLSLGSSINLRGLGPASTLVLFDNNRPALGGANGTFTDISLIPQIAVDRVEILSDGASAVYGSDAVAGVVNFRFRNRFEGAETWLRSSTADGDFGEHQIGQLVGARWRTGGVVLAYQYSERGDLPGSQRDYATDDLRPFGGGDFRSLFTTPGTIIAANGAVFGIPGGQNGVGLTPGQLLPGAQPRRDIRQETDLLPEQRSHSGFAAFDQQLLEGVSLFGRALYARRTYRFDRPLQSDTPIAVPVTNPFYVDPIGTRQPVRVRFDFGHDLGAQYRTGSATGLSLMGGLDVALGSWRTELSGSYGLQRERQFAGNLVNSFRLAQALADTSPTTAYNLFGDGLDTNPATIDRIRGFRRSRSRYAVWNTALRADGPLFDWSAGTVRLAVGGEHRDERLNTVLVTDVRAATPASAPLSGLPNKRNIDAVYAELLVPLAGRDLNWIPGSLDLSVAGRAEWYSDFGRTTNPKVGLAWRPLPGITVRGSYGTSFRAPGFQDLVGPSGNLYQPVQLADPQSPTGTSIALGLFGYSNEIGPEKAETWTAGLDIADLPITGLRLSATYFNIAYRDRIGSATADYLNFLSRRDLYGELVNEAPDAALVASYFADPGFADPLGVTPAQIDVIIDALYRNLSSTTVRGIDVDVGLTRPLLGGQGSFGIAGTRLLAIDQQITASAPTVNFASVLGNPVKLRLRGRAIWTGGGVELAAFVNYVGRYRNQLTTPPENVRPWTTVDASIGYRFPAPSPLARARIALTATNLFDRDPPFVINRAFDSTLGYDPEQASPVGRTLAIQFTLGL